MRLIIDTIFAKRPILSRFLTFLNIYSVTLKGMNTLVLTLSHLLRVCIGFEKKILFYVIFRPLDYILGRFFILYR